ncbi:MAG: hypothetical protein ABIG03_02220 [Candidatus Eisenbacteria bacterium]
MKGGVKETTLRRWHRVAGIFLALLIVVQAVSGLVIAFNASFRFHHDVSALLDARDAHALHYAWDYVFMDIHYGGGVAGAIYHIAVGVGLVWIVWTGALIYFRGVRRSRQARRRAAA